MFGISAEERISFVYRNKSFQMQSTKKNMRSNFLQISLNSFYNLFAFKRLFAFSHCHFQLPNNSFYHVKCLYQSLHSCSTCTKFKRVATPSCATSILDYLEQLRSPSFLFSIFSILFSHNLNSLAREKQIHIYIYICIYASCTFFKST